MPSNSALSSVVNDTIGDLGTMFGSDGVSSGVISSNVIDSDKVSTTVEHIDLTEMNEDNVDVEDSNDPTEGDIIDQLLQKPPVTYSVSTTDSSDDTASTSTRIVIPAGFNYDRDNENQKLIAVMGREFDLPLLVAENLNDAYTSLHGQENKVKFLGYVCKRQDLLLGKIHDAEVKRHDLVIMCYNASEARIMLTGDDGFYTKLLRQVYSLLGELDNIHVMVYMVWSIGTNKAVFAIIKYHQLSIDNGSLIPKTLSDRLSRQPELEDCLNNKQVMAWNEQPSAVHINKLVELAHVTGTPKHYPCNIL